MTIGAPARRRTSEAKLQDARVAAARRNTSWTEIEADLVPRDNGRVLVSASTDAAYTPARGALFETASAKLVADWTPYSFCVIDGELVVLERMPQTWSQIIERRARGEARRSRTAS